MEELLIRELCSLLPHGIICKTDDFGDLELLTIHYDGRNSLFRFINTSNGRDIELYLSEFKPYLLPLDLIKENIDFPEPLRDPKGMEIYIPSNQEKVYNFAFHDMDQILYRLRKHRIDFYGFIKAGLAIDATGLGIYGFN